MRADLPRGVLAAQVVHAAGESSPGALPPNTTAVVLSVRSEAHLERIEARLVAGGVAHRAIREPDAPWQGALMAIGICPVADRGPLRAYTRGLQLLR